MYKPSEIFETEMIPCTGCGHEYSMPKDWPIPILCESCEKKGKAESVGPVLLSEGLSVDRRQGRDWTKDGDGLHLSSMKRYIDEIIIQATRSMTPDDFSDLEHLLLKLRAHLQISFEKRCGNL